MDQIQDDINDGDMAPGTETRRTRREELEKRVEQLTADLYESNQRLRHAVEEEKKAREALNRSENLLRRVFNSMSGGVLVLGRNRRIQLANRSALSLLHLDVSIAGKTLNEVIPDFDISRLNPSSHDETETRVTLRDGRTGLFGLTAIRGEADDRTVIVVRDIAETVHARRRKMRADELALVGEMVRRLSHEIKNPIASVVVGLKTMQRAIPQSSQHGQLLRLISEEVDSLTTTVNRLLEAARTRVFRPRMVDVELLLRRCMDADGPLAMRRGVGLEHARSPDSSKIVVVERTMLLVMEHVIHNALDACSQGDVVRIGWRGLDEAERADLVPGYSGKAVVVFVEDSGRRIPEEPATDRSGAFREFVSTKTSGYGLGLTVVRDIVESFGGVVVVASRFNRGTIVRIVLPSPEAIPCWDWRRNRAADCQSYEDFECADCDVRSSYTKFCCWTVKGLSYHTETGPWPECCLDCGFFRSSSLTPFFRSRPVK